MSGFKWLVVNAEVTRLGKVWLKPGWVKVTSVTKRQLLKMCHLRHRFRFFISQESYVLFSRYSSLCTFHHLMIYPVCDVMMSITQLLWLEMTFFAKKCHFFQVQIKVLPPPQDIEVLGSCPAGPVLHHGEKVPLQPWLTTLLLMVSQ